MAVETEARIKEVIQRTYNVKSVRLEPGQPQKYEAGQFLSVVLRGDPALKKHLSLSSSPTEKGYIEFTKKLTGSDFSKALDALKVGDTVKLQYPFGKFTLEQAGDKVAFLSGGIGITPIRSMLKFVVDSQLDTDIVLVYANRTAKDIVFKNDLDAMQKDNPKLKVSHVLHEPDSGFKCVPGLINAQVIKNEVPDYSARKFFLCGPPQMVEAMRKLLADDLKVAQENIITENFQGY